MTDLEHKRKARRKETAEDFTPLPLVNEMLDKLPPEVWEDPNKTFLDNSAGNGNFLIEILKRKLSLGHDPIQAISSIYGVELMQDNVDEMKQRLLEVILEALGEHKNDLISEVNEILNHNIVCHDALTWDYENWVSPIKKSKNLF